MFFPFYYSKIDSGNTILYGEFLLNMEGIMNRHISKKAIFVSASLLSILVIVTALYGFKALKKNEQAQSLTELIDTPYEVMDVRQNKDDKVYDVDITADLSYADNILLANKLLKQLATDTNISKLNMNVYQDKATTKTKDTLDFTDPSYLYTIETNGSYVYQYEPLQTKVLTDDLFLSKQWEITDVTVYDNELSFNTILSDELTAEEVNSILNDLAEEMIRCNFDKPDKVSTSIQSTINNSETYYYLSEQPNYLIYKTRLIG